MIVKILYDFEALRALRIDSNIASNEADQSASHTLDLTWHVLAQRVWSSAVRAGSPPECYAGLLAANVQLRRKTAQMMRDNWRRLLLVEVGSFHEIACSCGLT